MILWPPLMSDWKNLWATIDVVPTQFQIVGSIWADLNLISQHKHFQLRSSTSIFHHVCLYFIISSLFCQKQAKIHCIIRISSVFAWKLSVGTVLVSIWTRWSTSGGDWPSIFPRSTNEATSDDKISAGTFSICLTFVKNAPYSFRALIFGAARRIYHSCVASQNNGGQHEWLIALLMSHCTSSPIKQSKVLQTGCISILQCKMCFSIVPLFFIHYVIPVHDQLSEMVRSRFPWLRLISKAEIEQMPCRFWFVSYKSFTNTFPSVAYQFLNFYFFFDSFYSLHCDHWQMACLDICKL